ncbi:MAG: hypothetical protein JKY46_01055 [Robiginitomaculum sp.]|nr:hypothetical protein [Robiginitomaculum sp.]
MSQRTVAFLTSSNMVVDGTNKREDSYEHDLEFGLFNEAAKTRNIKLVEVVWDEPDINWRQFDAVLVGTTWDYVQKRELFFAVMQQIDSQTLLLNSLETLKSNSDKQYLLDLAVKGVPTIPTISVDLVTAENVAAAFESFATDKLVIKPKIGAGAWRQVLLGKDQPIPPANELPEAGALLQPFLPSIQSHGELSMLFYDGEFSHAIRKTPKIGDYRIQSVYGGIDTKDEPSHQEMQLAKTALSALYEMPLYARVDIVLGLDMQPLLIELEMIEPYHYVEQGANCGNMLMQALLRRLQ